MQSISMPAEFIALEQVPTPGDFYNLNEGIRVDAQRLDPLALSITESSGMLLSQTVQSNVADALDQLGIDASIQISIMGGQFGLSAFAKLRKASATTDDALSLMRRCRLPRERVSVDLESLLSHVQLPEDANGTVTPSSPLGWYSATLCGATHVAMQVVRGHFAVLNVRCIDRGSSNLFSLAAGGSGTATYSGITGTLSASVQVEDDNADHNASIDVGMCVSDNDTTKSSSAAGLTGVQQYLEAVHAFNETAERLCTNDQPAVIEFVLVPMTVLEAIYRSRRRSTNPKLLLASPTLRLAGALEGDAASLMNAANVHRRGLGLAAAFLSTVATTTDPQPFNLQGNAMRLASLSGQLTFLRHVLAEMKVLCTSQRLDQWAMAAEWHDDEATRLARVLEDGQRSLQQTGTDGATATTSSLPAAVRWEVQHLAYAVLLDPVFALVHRVRASMEWRRRLLLNHHLPVATSLLDARLQCSGTVPIAVSGMAKVVEWTGTHDCTLYYRPAPSLPSARSEVQTQVASTTFRNVVHARHCAVVAQVAAVANQRRTPPGGLGLHVVDMLSSFGATMHHVADAGVAVLPQPPPLAPTMEWSAWGRRRPSPEGLLEPPRRRYLHGVVVVQPLDANIEAGSTGRLRLGASRHVVPVVSATPLHATSAGSAGHQRLVLAAYWTYHAENAASSIRVLNAQGECIADVATRQRATEQPPPADHDGGAAIEAHKELPKTPIGNLTACVSVAETEDERIESITNTAQPTPPSIPTAKRYLSLDKKGYPGTTTTVGHAHDHALRDVITDIGLWLGPGPPPGRLWSSCHVGPNCWVCVRTTRALVTAPPFVETGVYRIEPVGSDTTQAVGFNEGHATPEDRCADVREGVPVSAFAADVRDASQEWVVKRVGYDTYAVQAACRIGVPWVWTAEGAAAESVSLGRDAATTAQRFRIEWAGSDAAAGDEEDGAAPPDADVFTIKTLPSEKALAVLFDSASSSIAAARKLELPLRIGDKIQYRFVRLQ